MLRVEIRNYGISIRITATLRWRRWPVLGHLIITAITISLPSPWILLVEFGCRTFCPTMGPPCPPTKGPSNPCPPLSRATMPLSSSSDQMTPPFSAAPSSSPTSIFAPGEVVEEFIPTELGGFWKILTPLLHAWLIFSDAWEGQLRAARAALSAIARHLRLRSDVFNHLLDDNPLPANEASSAVLVATFSHISLQQGKCITGGGKPALSCEIEKGMLMLVSADAPGLQVCDPNGRWYQADSNLVPGDLLLLTGKALSHATAGLRPAASYRLTPDNLLVPPSGGRISLAFITCHKGMQFWTVLGYHWLDMLFLRVMCQYLEQSLRSVLSDPLSGAFLEDGMLLSCGHSFGGLMLRKVML